ncbi:calcium-binding protein [Microvirga aerilata]|uniref:Calcium-binding protein n=1 Tax=Microvirga aerilata TaxID=670292 RepID=A0A937CYF0_9HYPH|nr:calcium-binding protein [Microvirga aerilata]MBL0402782.1 calcium-binding protein [Microvirga aerilata]
MSAQDQYGSDQTNFTAFAGEPHVINGNDTNEVLDGLDDASVDYADVIYGHGGNDTINGGDGKDFLHGGAGNDSINGGDNNDDTLVGGEGEDVLNGGSGISYWDFASYAQSSFGLTLNLRNTALSTGQARNDKYISIEGIIGTDYNDLIVGNGDKHDLRAGAGNDTVIGGSGQEIMDGGDGIDTVSYELSTQGVSVSLGAGGGGVNDSQSDTWKNFENVRGSNYNDSLSGDANANHISGGLGADSIYAGDGNDTLDAGSGADHMQGGAGSDVYYVDNAKDEAREQSYHAGTDTVITSVSYDAGFSAVEILQAAAGYDPINLTGNEYTTTLIGNDGSNVLKSDGGGSVMMGGGGNDVYYIDSAADQIVDTGGVDVAYATTSFTLASNSGIDQVYAVGEVAVLNGNAFDNVLLGTSGKNTMNGGGGNDKIYGKGGKDVLTGGAGKDWFVFDTKLGKSSMDTVKDFKAGQDKIVLDNALFKSNKSFYGAIKKGTPDKPLKLGKSFFTIGSDAKDKSDYLVYNKKTGVLSYDKDGSGRGDAVEIAKFSNKTSLSYKDFDVI